MELLTRWHARPPSTPSQWGRCSTFSTVATCSTLPCRSAPAFSPVLIAAKHVELTGFCPPGPQRPVRPRLPPQPFNSLISLYLTETLARAKCTGVSAPIFPSLERVRDLRATLARAAPGRSGSRQALPCQARSLAAPAQGAVAVHPAGAKLADALGVSERNLYRLLHRYGLG